MTIKEAAKMYGDSLRRTIESMQGSDDGLDWMDMRRREVQEILDDLDGKDSIGTVTQSDAPRGIVGLFLVHGEAI